MLSPINSSPRAIRQFAREIHGSLKKMKRCNEELLEGLKTLERTFKDEDINIVRSNVKSTERKLEDLEPEIEKVCRDLAEYAEHLERSKL